MKNKIMKLLSIGAVILIVITQFTGVFAVESAASIFSGYVTTDEMTDKTDTVQANYQEADTLGVDIVYSEDFIQSVEWADQEEGEALLSLYYSAEFDDIDVGSRVLYVMTTCNLHGFTRNYAAANIVDLLQYYDYVDIIVIGVYDFPYYKISAGAVATFTVYAGDFEDRGSYTKNSSGVPTSFYGGTSSIYGILGYPGRYGSNYYTTIHDLGYVAGDEEDNGGASELLYSYSYYSSRTVTSAATALRFDGQRHNGAYLMMVFLQDYVELIKEKFGDFSHTVEGIYLSFDGFMSAYETAAISYSDACEEGTYPYILDELGLDMTAEITSFSVLEKTVPDALEILLQYDQEGRYTVMTTKLIGSGSDDSALSVPISSAWWYSETVKESRSVYVKNRMLYSWFLFQPSAVYGNESAYIDQIDAWLSLDEEDGVELTPEMFGALSYTETFSDLGIFGNSADTKTLTFTIKLDSRFGIIDTDEIVVTATNDWEEQNTIKVDSDISGVTTFTAEISTIMSSLDFLIEIPIKLVLDKTQFHNNEDFADVVVQDSTVILTRYVTDFDGDEIINTTETLSVASPILYKHDYFNLYYDLNGGTGTEPTDDTDYSSGETATLTDTPTVSNTGVVIIGWSLDSQYDIDNPLTDEPTVDLTTSSVVFDDEDITVYAVYAKDRNNNGVPDYDEVLHLSYDMNGDSTTTPADSADYIPDDTVTLVDISSVTPNTSGIIFLGWSDTKQSNGSATNPLTETPASGLIISSVKFVDSDITVYAVYAADRNGNNVPDYNEYLHLHYDLNGASGTTPTDDTNYIPDDTAYLINPDGVSISTNDIVFIGWSGTQQSNGSATNPLTSVPNSGVLISSVDFTDSDITVYAVYAKDRNNNGVPDYNEVLHLYYDMNDDGGTAPTDDTEYIPNDVASLVDPDDVSITSSGVVLIGWSETRLSDGNATHPLSSAPADGAIIDSVEFVDQDIIVYAVYAIDQNYNGTPDYDEYLHLYYDLNGASGTTPTDGTNYIPDGSATLVTKDSVSIDSGQGIIFVGWSNTRLTEGSALNPLAKTPDSGVLIGSVDFTDSDITVYAVYVADRNNNGIPDYEETTYSLIYDINGGNEAQEPTDDNDYLTNEIVKLDDGSGISYDGYSFVGWSYDCDYGIDNAIAEDAMIPEDLIINSVTFASDNETVCAVWQEGTSYGLTYDLNGGEGTEPTDTNRYKSGETVTLDDADYSYGDLIFIGWSFDSSYNTDNPLTGDIPDGLIIDGSVTFEDSGITVYAVWYRQVASIEPADPDDDDPIAEEKEIVIEADIEEKASPEVVIPDTSVGSVSAAGLTISVPLIALLVFLFKGRYLS